jgi:YD repeat-containing protein
MTQRCLSIALLGACSASLGPPTPPASPFDSAAEFVPAPAGCTYQRFEHVHALTGVGELSGCLDLPIAGNGVLSIVYSDFLGGTTYVGGIAGATATVTDAIAVTTGPHTDRYTFDGARYVPADAADGTWLELAGDQLDYRSGPMRVRFARSFDGLFRAVDIAVLGGPSGFDRVSGTRIERAFDGTPTALLDDFDRGTQLDYAGGHLARLTDIDTGDATELQWSGDRVVAIVEPSTSGSALVTQLAYAGDRLAGITTPEQGSVAWDRPAGAQVATTRFLAPTGAVVYAVTSAACIATTGSTALGIFGHPYGSTRAPAIYTSEQLLDADRSTALPTRRRTDDLHHYVEVDFDDQRRASRMVDDRGVGLTYSYAGGTARVAGIDSAATGIALFRGVVAGDPPGPLVYASAHGLDGVDHGFSYDAAGRITSISFGGTTMRRAYYALADGTRTCDTVDGQSAIACLDADGHGMATQVYDAGAALVSLGYDQGRVATHVNSLGDATRFTYDAANRLQRSDYPAGVPAATYTYTAGGAPRSVSSGLRAVDYTFSEAGALDGANAQLAGASWSHVLSRSADQLTLTYFINGQQLWSVHSAPAPDPAPVTCAMASRGGGK